MGGGDFALTALLVAADNVSMSNCLRKLIGVLVVTMIHSCCQLEARGVPRSKKNRQQWSIGIPRYVIGGVIGSTLGVGFPLAHMIMVADGGKNDFSWALLGSGIGHAVQGRWWDGHGFGFTMGGFYTYAALSGAEGENDNRPFTWTMFLGTKLAELITVWSPPYRSALAPKKMDESRYVAGGTLGTIFGFGSGHLIQGRGIAGAWPYALTQISALSMFYTEEQCRRTKYGHCGMIDGSAVMGILFYGLSKIIEIASLWGPSAKNYQIVSTTDNSSPKLTLIPLFHRQQPKLALRLTVAL